MTVGELIEKLKNIRTDDVEVRVVNIDYELREHKEVIDLIDVSGSERDYNGVYLVFE